MLGQQIVINKTAAPTPNPASGKPIPRLRPPGTAKPRSPHRRASAGRLFPSGRHRRGPKHGRQRKQATASGTFLAGAVAMIRNTAKHQMAEGTFREERHGSLHDAAASVSAIALVY